MQAGFDQADEAILEEVGAVGAGHSDGFLGPQTGGDEQLHLPLIAESRHDAAPARGIDAGKQPAARGEERALELHFLAEQPAPCGHAGRAGVRPLRLFGAIVVLQAGHEHVERAGIELGVSGEGFEDRERGGDGYAAPHER